ncbi:winged helix-turn-helix domain-containing protein [Enterococcus sp. AZ072]|uniref:winged helix-turn-helix domain-containing protein n=1 Tax=unclassified Enterococcus TaxID=2608891 RepID=UPI003D2E9002
MKILILTKNLLAETECQNKLQQLNNEVLCSTSLVKDSYMTPGKTEAILSYFSLVILSETISYQEIKAVVPIIRKHATAIVRKFESDYTKDFEEEQTEYVIDQWIRKDASLEEVRELCQAITQRESDNQVEILFSNGKGVFNKGQYHFYDIGFSKRESALLLSLYECRGSYLSREELCGKIWKEKLVSNSQRSALSTCVRNIKSKVRKIGIPCEPIETAWGKGYQISDEFYQLIKV